MRQQQSDLYKIHLSFDRGNATFKPQQTVTGIIRMQHKHGTPFRVDVSSLTITPTGLMQLNNKQNSKKLQPLIHQCPPIKTLNLEPIQIAKNKTLNETAQLAFRFKLTKGDHKLAQTYIGVYISITYQIEVHVRLSNNPNMIAASFPFYIQVPKQGRDTIQQFIFPKKKSFMIKSEDISGNKVPKFKIRGQLQSQICFISEDLYGTLIIDLAQSPIRQIDVQMYRVEKISANNDTVTERTQIQLIQMCDGNVTRNMDIPINMILPRYYCCPSLKYMWCQLDFEIDLQIIFKDGFKVTVNIPLKLIRS